MKKKERLKNKDLTNEPAVSEHIVKNAKRQMAEATNEYSLGLRICV